MNRQPNLSIEQYSVVSSIFDADALCAAIGVDYDIIPLQCDLWFVGTTDTYLVTTDYNRYMLRIYAAGTRTDDDVQFELAALRHLHQKGVSVAVPIRRRDGEWFGTIDAPEGPRQQVLFTYASGREAYEEAGYPERLGRSIAELHTASDDFQSPFTRFHIDEHILLDRPLRWVEPLLKDRPADWQALHNIAARLQQHLATHFQRGGLSWGFCHGDALGSNAHLEADTLTHFDFNDCGLGWRAYDLASFLWIKTWRNAQTVETEWAEYLKGYRAVRPLSSADLDVVPIFVGLREFWIMGQQAHAATQRGLWWVQDRFFAQRIEFLRKWEQQHFAGA